MSEKIVADLEACKTCTVGSCCYEGTELNKKELKQILRYNPAVAKPWFRLLTEDEKPDGEHHFSTVVRDGTCVFQDKNNRCLVYKVRPHYCRDFPLEDNETAPHYKRLCVLFHEQWAKNDSVRRTFEQRQNAVERKK